MGEAAAHRLDLGLFAGPVKGELCLQAAGRQFFQCGILFR